MQTLTTTLCNMAGDKFETEVKYEIDGDYVIVEKPLFIDETFGEGWIDDLVLFLTPVIDFDYQLKIKSVMGTVIFDKETREYMEGWNANMDGKNFLSNPYSCLRYDGELYRLWQQGFEDSQSQWNNGDVAIPTKFSDENVKYAFTINERKVCV